MTARTLTARSVKTMLTRRGIDSSTLVLTELADSGSVRIDGPEAARKAATSALVLNYDNPVRDMWTAPYVDHDILTRR